jgi:hypothetical protein
MHNIFAWNEWCNVSKRMLQRIMYIMMSRRIAGTAVSQVDIPTLQDTSVFLFAMLDQSPARSFQE